MRRVRSHVMYTHREGLSPTETGGSREGSRTPVITTRTPSPGTGDSRNITQVDTPQAPVTGRRHVAVWEQDRYEFHTLSTSTHPVRVLAARIHSAIAEASAHSTPPVFEEVSGYPFPGVDALRREPFNELKRDWIRATTFYCYGTCALSLQNVPTNECRPSLDAVCLRQSPFIPQSCTRYTCLSRP